MKLVPFMVLTTLGATIWCAVLVALGFYFGNPAMAIIKEYSHEAAIIIIPLIALYLWWKIWGSKKRKQKKATPQQ
jgi:membrane protein DedA with SNARE-associated domain